MPQALEKLAALRKEITKRGLDIMLEVDGGINAEPAPQAVRAGTDVLVAGSFVFSAEDMKSTVKSIKNL